MFLSMSYANGKIYSIKCNITGEVYIGSTVLPFEKRMHSHLYKMNFLNYTSANILKRGNYTCSIIENYPCNSKVDLEARECYWMDMTPNCINALYPSKKATLLYYQKKGIL